MPNCDWGRPCWCRDCIPSVFGKKCNCGEDATEVVPETDVSKKTLDCSIVPKFLCNKCFKKITSNV